jgi:hypothetical protein
MKDWLGKDYQIGYYYPELPRHQQNGCINYDECPLCYQCRAYDTRSLKCESCKVGPCNKTLHTPHWIAKCLYQHPALEVI